jgi:alpha-glucoside transport system permease protein
MTTAQPPRMRPVDRLLVLDDVGPTRRDRIRPETGRAYLYLAPATLVVGGLLVWPAIRTVVDSLTIGCRGVCLANFTDAWSDPLARRALLRTLAWAVALPVVLTAVGYLLAVVSRRVRRAGVLTVLLVAPMALPMLATAVAFRLLYDPDPSRGLVTALTSRLVGVDAPQALGPGLVTFAMMSAFVWAYLGLSVVVFRRVLDAIPSQQVSMIMAETGRRREVYRWLYWPILRRVAALLVGLAGLFSARSFDLLLALVPGSSQPAGEVLALHVWRYGAGPTAGPAAALSVLWFAVLALTVVLPLISFRAQWRMPPVDVTVWDRHLPARYSGLRHRLAQALCVVAIVLWLIPAALLVFASLHADATLASRGLSGGLSLASFGEVLGAGGMLGNYLGTGLFALLVAVLVVAFAGPAAYALGWLRPPGRGALLLVVVVCATVPVQAITIPLVQTLGAARLSGTGQAFVLAHLALGIPLTTALLYGAFGSLSPEQMRQAAIHHGAEAAGPARATLMQVGPNLFAAGVLQFVQVWNDVAVGLLFAPPQLSPIGLSLLGQLRYYSTGTGHVAAATVLFSVVPLVAVMVARKQIVRLLMAGVSGNWQAKPTKR